MVKDLSHALRRNVVIRRISFKVLAEDSGRPGRMRAAVRDLFGTLFLGYRGLGA